MSGAEKVLYFRRGRTREQKFPGPAFREKGGTRLVVGHVNLLEASDQ